jgi:hypothetical protein
MTLIHPFPLGSFYGAIGLIINPTLIFMIIINMAKIHPFNLHPPKKIKSIETYQFGLIIHHVNIKFTHVNKKNSISLYPFIWLILIQLNEIVTTLALGL